MARVTNNSQQALSIVVPPNFNAFLAPRKDGSDKINPKSESDIPDEVAKKWANKGMVDFLIRQGAITVEYGDKDTGLLGQIAEITDPDEIEAMFAETDDPAMQEALEKRMEEIS